MITLSWGEIPYTQAVDRQLEEVERVAAGETDRLIFCSHPPVVTLGRASQNEDIISWQGPTVEVSRGGRATYHGPNQLVIYPICDLKKYRQAFSPRDVRAYLQALGLAVVDALAEIGMNAEYRSMHDPGGISVTGVWVGDHKIASLGVAVRKWVTYHGIALNVLHDENAFLGIRPCGFQPSTMTSLERILERQVSVLEVQQVLERAFYSRLR